MIRRFRLRRAGWLAGLLLAVAGAARAQVLILDTFDANGATGSVVSSPIPSSWVSNITRNAGSITVGGTARDDNGWSASGFSLDGSGMSYLRISGQVEAGNAARAISVQLLDAYLNSVVFSVSTSAFATESPSQVQIPIASWDAGFDPASISSWSIGGGTTGLVTFHMTLDHLALASSLIPLAGGGRITTAGDQVYSTGVSLGAATTLGSTGSNGNAITFSSTIDGAQSLTLNTPGTTTLNGAVGNTSPLASLTTDAGGTTAINGGKVFTSGNQTYGDRVTLGADTELRSTGGGIHLIGDLDGNGHRLIFNAAQASVLHSASNLSGFIKAGAGTLTLTGQNTFSGEVSVLAGTLLLGMDNALSPTSALTLAGGVFATGGYSQALGKLTLAGASTIDFGAGMSDLAFASSYDVAWSGTLFVLNYTSGMDTLRFGSDASGLTQKQLDSIDFGAGSWAVIDSSGFVTRFYAVPEASDYAAIAGSAALAGALWGRRVGRKKIV